MNCTRHIFGLNCIIIFFLFGVNCSVSGGTVPPNQPDSIALI